MPTVRRPCATPHHREVVGKTFEPHARLGGIHGTVTGGLPVVQELDMGIFRRLQQMGTQQGCHGRCFQLHMDTE